VDSVPKKFLGVSNLIFILPDDFEGDITDALPLMVEYINDVVNKAKEIKIKEENKESSIFESLLKSSNKNRITGKFIFYEFDEITQSYVESPQIKTKENE